MSADTDALTDDITAIRDALADKALPRQRWAWGTFSRLLVVPLDDNGHTDKHSPVCVIPSGDFPHQAEATAKADYIAACHPERIARLLGEITRLRAALAQAGAGREPIGYMNEGHLHELKKERLPYGYVYPSAAVGAETPIYTAHPSPAQREPLSDVEIDAATAVARDALMDHVAEYGTIAEGQQRHIRDIARAIERAYGITTSGTKGAAS